MNCNARSRQSTCWRWALIIAEVLVLGCDIAWVGFGWEAKKTSGTAIGFAAVAGIALFFLFFGSPFLVRSQGGLAILGWCIAFGTILGSLFLPKL